MLDKARANRQKKPRPAKAEDLPLLDTKAATDFLKSVGSRWPEVRERITPFLHSSKEKLGDVYSSIAQVLAAQKEAFEDRLAEKKNRAQPTPPKKRRPAAHSADEQV